MSELRSRNSAPLVTVVMPCYNEVDFAADVLASILAQDYPVDRLEFVVVDGGSTDGTLEVLKRAAERDDRLRIIDNPARVKPRALNLGIEASRGEIIIRVDAHAVYPPDYVRLCVEHLEKSGADNVGGYRETRPRQDTAMGRAIALSIGSRFGSGGATYRTGASTTRWVDTVFGGCYRRELFHRLGLFDERLDRGQDREFNVRLTRSGGKILFVPEIRWAYYARSDLKGFLPWIFVCGVTPFLISRIAGTRIWSRRNLVPPSFVLAVVLLPLFAIAIPVVWLWWLGLIGVYSGLAVGFAATEAKSTRDWKAAAALVFVFLATHVLYGVGALVGHFTRLPKTRGWAKT